MFLSKLGYSELVQRLFEKMTFFLVDPLPFPRSLLPFFNKDTSFNLLLVLLLHLITMVWHRLPFFLTSLPRVLLGDMTPPRSWLLLGHLLPPSPRIFLFLSPPIARILTGLTTLLPSLGEWGSCVVWGELGAWDFVAPSFALLFIQVFLPTQMTTLFMPTTFPGLSQRKFLWSSFIVRSLWLLGDIPTFLHLWRLPLLLQFLGCTLCPVVISPPLQVLTSLCVRMAFFGMSNSSGCRLLSPTGDIQFFFPLHVSTSLLFVLQNPSSFLRSRISRVIWTCKMKLISTFGLTITPPVARMPFSSLTLPTLRPVVIERVSFELLSRMGGSAFFLTTLDPVFMAKVLR